LFKTLKSKLAQTKRNVVFFVNGSGQDFDHVARAGAALEAEYGVEVVLLAWPSAESNSRKHEAHYGYCMKLASGGNLQSLYSKLLAEKQEATDLSGIAVRDPGIANLWHLK
jgi:hypothetical protein